MLSLEKGQYVNLVVAFSNLSALVINHSYNLSGNLYYLIPMVASFLMHISERKHGLQGFPPFNRFSREFLWIDRIVAYISVGVVLYNFNNLSGPSILYGLFGLLCLFISENIPGGSQGAEKETLVRYTQDLHWIIFSITHCLWHVLAFYVLCMSFNPRVH
jgi:hypothetical protein